MIDFSLLLPSSSLISLSAVLIDLDQSTPKTLLTSLSLILFLFWLFVSFSLLLLMIEFSACVPRCLPTWSLSLSLHSALLSFSYTHPSIHLASFRRPPLHTHTQQSRAKANSNQSIRTRLMTRWMMMPRLYQSDLHIGLSLVSVSTTLARPFLIHPPTLLQTETHFGSDRVNRTKKTGGGHSRA